MKRKRSPNRSLSAQDRETLSVVVPAFNEEFRITPTLRSIRRASLDRGGPFEILVVDDGSSDQTAQVVEDLRGEIPELRCLRSPANRGKGHAVRVGMLAARGGVRLMSDADGSIPAGEMPKILAPVLSGEVDVCIGSRHMEESSANVSPPPWRRIWSEISNLVVRATLLPGIKDTQCGFKAFSGEAAEAVFSQAQIDGWAFDLEALSLARRFGFAVREVGVHWSDDKRSRVDPAQDFLRVVREWSRIRRNLRHGVYCFAETEL